MNVSGDIERSGPNGWIFMSEDSMPNAFVIHAHRARGCDFEATLGLGGRRRAQIVLVPLGFGKRFLGYAFQQFTIYFTVAVRPVGGAGRVTLRRYA